MMTEAPEFDLAETMRFDPSEGVPLLERHLARMKASAEELGFVFDRHHARNELQAGTFRLRVPHQLRLLLSPSGAIAIEARPLGPVAPRPLKIRLAASPLAGPDLLVRHRTSKRNLYDTARLASRADEVLFVDHAGQVIEGSFTHLFVERDGKLMTPPRIGGQRSGVLRDSLVEDGQALERELVRDDLKGTFLVGNAVRGLIAARLIED